MKYDEVENTLPEFNTAELGLTPPSTQHVAKQVLLFWPGLCNSFGWSLQLFLLTFITDSRWPMQLLTVWTCLAGPILRKLRCNVEIYSTQLPSWICQSNVKAGKHAETPVSCSSRTCRQHGSRCSGQRPEETIKGAWKGVGARSANRECQGFPQCQGGFRVKILRFGRLGRNFKALWVGFAQLVFEASTRGREGLGLNFMASG